MATVYTIAVLAAPLIAALAYLVSHPQAGPDSWRILMWTMGGLGLVVWIIRFRVPESPRWYESHGQDDKANALMADIETKVMRQRGLTELAPIRESVAVLLGFLTTFTLWQFSNFLHTYQAEIFPARVRSTASGTVYSVSRVSAFCLP